MKTEQEQIEEIAKIICENYGTNYCKEFCGIETCSDPVVAQDIYNQGYRKATEVIDEFVERLKSKALTNCKIVDCYEIKFIETKIDDIAAEMRQEVK